MAGDTSSKAVATAHIETEELTEVGFEAPRVWKVGAGDLADSLSRPVFVSQISITASTANSGGVFSSISPLTLWAQIKSVMRKLANFSYLTGTMYVSIQIASTA